MWLLQQPLLIDKRKRAVLPAVRERQSLADALARYLAMLGLGRQRKVKTVRSGQSDACQNPFCKFVIEPLPDGWRRTKRRYCSNPCKLDGYALPC